MSREQDQLTAMLNAIFAPREPVEIVRVEYTEKGYAFVAHAANGDAYGGNMGDKSLSVETIKERLVADAESGGLGQYFARYQPVEATKLKEVLAANDDWADIYVKQA